MALEILENKSIVESFQYHLATPCHHDSPHCRPLEKQLSIVYTQGYFLYAVSPKLLDWHMECLDDGT